MLIDGGLTTLALAQVPQDARDLDALGYDGLFTFEGKDDPFLPLVLAAVNTRGSARDGDGDRFPRTPMLSRTSATICRRSRRDASSRARRPDPAAHRAALLTPGRIRRRACASWCSRSARSGAAGTRASSSISAASSNAHADDAVLRSGPEPARAAHLRRRRRPQMTEAAGEVADGFFVHPFNTPESCATRRCRRSSAGRARGRRREGFEIMHQR